MFNCLKYLVLFLALVGSVPSYADRHIVVSDATAARRRIPFVLVDRTDNNTRETAITITGAECRISKNGGTEANCANAACSTNCLTHVGNGVYYYELTTGEADTAGYVTVTIDDAASRVETNQVEIYGMNVASTAPNVNIISASADSIPSTAFAADGQLQGAASTTSVTLAAGETANDITDQVLCFVDGPAVKDCALITAYNTGTKVATLTPALSNTPAATNKYVIGGLNRVVTDSVKSGAITASAFATNAIDANAFNQTAADKVWGTTTRAITDKANFTIAAADKNTLVDLVWDEAQSGHSTAGTFGYILDSRISDISGGVADWTSNEKQQIRQALGVSGTQLDATGGDLQAAATNVSTILGQTGTSGVKVASLEQDAIVDKVWDEARSSHVTAGTFGSGVVVNTNNDKTGYSISGTKQTLDALNDVSSGTVLSQCTSALNTYDAPTNAEMVAAFTQIKGATWSASTDTLELILDAAAAGGGGGACANTGEIADAVWDEAIAGHLTVGSAGNLLNRAATTSLQCQVAAQ